MSWLSRLANTLRAAKVDRDLDDELAFHVDARTRDLGADGLPPDAARSQALRELGASIRHREASRDVKLLPWLESVGQDVRYACRSLRRSPAFTLGAVTALVIGIGLNTGLFTVFNALALRPWPVADPSRVVTVFNVQAGAGDRGTTGFSLAEYRYLRDRTRTMSGLLAWKQGSGRLGHEEPGGYTLFQYVSANFFDVLGVRFALGRGFAPDEDRIGAPRAVAVLHHALWTRQFGADPGVVGRTVRLDDVPFTIIGVTAPEFSGAALEPYDLWVPLAALTLLKTTGTQARDMLEKPAHCCSAIAGRLAPGASRAAARAELDVLHRAFAAQAGFKTGGVHVGGTAFLSQTDDDRREVSGVFALMFAALTLVLLLACANVANLLLARALARQREIGVRLSIGASRWRLVRQLLTESLVLVAIAAALALPTAYVTTTWTLPVLFGELPSAPFTLDRTVLVYAGVLAAATCLLFGLAPAWKATAGGHALHRPATSTRVLSLRGTLLAAQVAVSVVLLVGASLLVRGVREARLLDPGFQIADVSVVSMSLPSRAYASPARTRTLLAQVISAMRETPGLWPAALTANVPLSGSHSAGMIRRFGENESTAQLIEFQEISPAYFEVLRIPMIAGRGFTDADADKPYAVVNESLARRFWPDRPPVGQRLSGAPSLEVIGVVRDARVADLHRDEPMFFVPFSGGLTPRLIVRGLEPTGVGRLTGVVSQLDPRVSIQTHSLTWYVDRWMQPARGGAAVASIVGLLALGLASIGVFGVFAYLVEERRREIGIRMAIGARAHHVVGLVLGSAARAVGGGLALGLTATLFATRALDSYLFGVSHFDTTAYAAVAALLGSSAIAAASIPIRTALQVDPVDSIRVDG